MDTNDADTLMEFLAMPLATSEAVFRKFAEIPSAMARGSGLERFLFVPGSRDDRVLLVAHADTVWDSNYSGGDLRPKRLIRRGGTIRNRNGGLGADDRAGCAIVWLLRETGHSLLITDGEELGCQGARWLMRENADIAAAINGSHQFAVQFDRRNDRDFKCYSVGTDEFRGYVRRATDYTEPDRSSSTDIVALCRDICGVNLSIGYGNEHSDAEYLVEAHWSGTLELCRRWLSQDRLPRFQRDARDPLP